jgi:hypothetical protein
MHFKFQIGDLVVDTCYNSLAMITDRIAIPHNPRTLRYDEGYDEVYTLLISDGREYEEHGDYITKVSENNEL